MDDATDAQRVTMALKALDQNLLSCMSKSAQSNHPGRALDYTTLLQEPASYELALQVAVRRHQPKLAERINMIKV